MRLSDIPIRRLATVMALALLATIGAGAASADPLPPVVPPPVPGAPATPATPQAAPRTAGATGGEAMTGTFKITGGSCASNVAGSFFRMIQPGGNASAGPYVQNSDSPCSDKTYTPMLPGTDGGLTAGAYQAEPNPAFDGTGNGLAARITKPQKFYGVDFATATNPTDPQTGTKVTAPALAHDGSGKLSGDLRAFAASWNNQHFNQGAPKPDGSTPGTTAGPSGTYDAASGHFVLEWTSQIVGGPFNNFTGQWHFEGTFVSSSSSSSTSAAAASTSSSGSGSSPSSGAAPAGSAAGSSGRVAGASGASTSGSSNLARTGPTFPPELGFVALLAGMAALVARRRAMAGAPTEERA